MWSGAVQEPLRGREAFMAARCGSPEVVGSSMNGRIPPPTGDHKGPPPVHPTTLAPTESSIELRLMPMGDLYEVGPG